MSSFAKAIELQKSNRSDTVKFLDSTHRSIADQSFSRRIVIVTKRLASASGNIARSLLEIAAKRPWRNCFSGKKKFDQLTTLAADITYRDLQ